MLSRKYFTSNVEILGPISFSHFSHPHELLVSASSISNSLGAHSPFLNTYIIRGIGYRVTLVINPWLNSKLVAPAGDLYSISAYNDFSYYQSDIPFESCWKSISNHEYPFSRYLLIRVGHSYHSYLPIPNFVGVKVSKKERKLVIYGPSANQVSLFSKRIYYLRPPSVYTGRGIRSKGIITRRKLGKKDIRKGRFF